MEQHPVPQNVTTFQFRLIGDMTLKQFGYLVGGAILAYIFYKLPLPLFLNWPLAIVSGLGGFGFAFVPIEERPMDVWVLSFFKSIYSPTQYVWSRAPEPKTQPVARPATPPVQTAIPAASAPIQTAVPSPTTRRGDILNNIFSPAQGAVLSQGHPRGPLDWLFDFFLPRPKIVQPTPYAATPATVAARMDMTPPPSVRAREQAIEQATQKEAVLESKLTTLQKELATSSGAEARVLELQKQLTELLADRDKMMSELGRLRMQTTPSAPPASADTYIATPASQKGPSVRIITPDRAVKAGLPRLTTFANVVTGIVKDGDQNLLPGVLVTVKDKDGMPLRALKTNRLGQFAASTPIANGTYLVEVEDPRLRFTFDRAQITLNGSIVPALEIFAKSQKEITRAKLEKELFGDKAQ